MNDLNKRRSFTQIFYSDYLNYYKKNNTFYGLVLNLKGAHQEVERNCEAWAEIEKNHAWDKKNAEEIHAEHHVFVIYFTTQEAAHTFGWNFMKNFPAYIFSYDTFKPIFFIDTYWPGYKIRKDARNRGWGRDGLWAWLFLWRVKKFTVEVANTIAEKYGAFRRQGRGKDAPGWGFWEYRHFVGAIQEMRGKLAPLKAYIPTNIQCDIDLNKTVYQNDILAEDLTLIAGKVTKKEIVKV